MNGIAYIGIGNTDNRLGQGEWSDFCRTVTALVVAFADRHRQHGARIVSVGFSPGASPWQTATFAVQLPQHRGDAARALKNALRVQARTFRQDSIAWALAPITEFLTPEDPDAPP